MRIQPINYLNYGLIKKTKQKSPISFKSNDINEFDFSKTILQTANKELREAQKTMQEIKAKEAQAMVLQEESEIIKKRAYDYEYEAMDWYNNGIENNFSDSISKRGTQIRFISHSDEDYHPDAVIEESENGVTLKRINIEKGRVTTIQEFNPETNETNQYDYHYVWFKKYCEDIKEENKNAKKIGRIFEYSTNGTVNSIEEDVELFSNHSKNSKRRYQYSSKKLYQYVQDYTSWGNFGIYNLTGKMFTKEHEGWISQSNYSNMHRDVSCDKTVVFDNNNDLKRVYFNYKLFGTKLIGEDFEYENNALKQYLKNIDIDYPNIKTSKILDYEQGCLKSSKDDCEGLYQNEKYIFNSALAQCDYDESGNIINTSRFIQL